MKRLLCLIFFMSLMLGANAQVDTEFWFAAPDLEAQHAQQPIRFCISSFETPATVVFDQPANPDYTAQTFQLGANDFCVYDVSSIIQMVETQPYNTVLNTGFHITSDTPVEVYYESDNNNSEIYSLKGANALGTRFLVPMQYTYKNHYSTTCSRIEVVATQDATTVTFVPSQNLKGDHQAGVPFSVTLNRGQSYAIESSSPYAEDHLYNTWVTSDKPIAVNTSDDSVSNGGNYDLVGDQIVPVELLGNEYLALWNNTPREYLYFFPTEDDTKIYLDGNPTPIATLNVGDKYQYHLNSAAVYINSDKPIAVFQLACASSSTSEFGGTMLPHINCTGSRKTVYRRNSTSNIVITLVVRTDCIGDFILNGNASYLTAADFSEVSSNGFYSYCRKNVSQYVPTNGLMTIENTNENGYYQLGVFSGATGTCTYGYFSDYQQYATATFDMDDTYCTGDDIVFNYNFENLDEVTLVLPDGSTMTQPPFILNNVQAAQAGTYYLQGEICNEVQMLDEIEIHINGPATDTINLSGCGQHHWHGFVFEGQVDTTVVISNPEGCDSIFYVHSAVVGLYLGDDVYLTGCGVQHWHGLDFTHNLDTIMIFNNENDCDSIYKVHVSIEGAYTDNVNLTGCGEQYWNGFVFDHTVDTVVAISNPGDCDSLYNVHVEIENVSMGIDGLTIIAVASDLWPGVYNYHISNSEDFAGCDINWTCSNPNWTITPFTNDPYWVRLIANTLGDATLTAQATCSTGCDATAVLQLNASYVGVEEVDDNSVSVYPNPANDNVIIKGERLKQVTIYNCYGQKCLDFALDSADEIAIGTAALTGGMYAVEIVSAKGKIMRRLMIAK